MPETCWCRDKANSKANDDSVVPLLCFRASKVQVHSATAEMELLLPLLSRC